MGQILVSGLCFLVIQTVGGPCPTTATAVSSEDSVNTPQTALSQYDVMRTVTGGTQSRPSLGPSLQPCELRVAARTQEPKAELLMPTSVPHDHPVDAGIKAVWVNT